MESTCKEESTRVLNMVLGALGSIGSQIKDDQVFSSLVARNGAVGMERTFCGLIITERVLQHPRTLLHKPEAAPRPVAARDSFGW